MDPRVQSFHAAVDKRPISRFQIRLVALAFALLAMDGYDIQAIGYVAPVLSAAWHLDRGAFGPIFGAGLIGLTVGTLVFAPMSDRIGCRPVLIGCTLFYGALTLATAFADSWSMLLALRFLTGLGLGSAMPSTISLLSDYMPARHRNVMVMLALCGFGLGGAVGGFAAAAMIPHFGWRSVFVLGGLVPLATIPLFLRWLPESLPRLLADPEPKRRLAAIAEQLAPGWIEPSIGPADMAAARPRFPVSALFEKNYAVPTLLFWTIFICNLLLVYFFVNWIPTLVSGAGQTLQVANIAAGIFQLAGIGGGLLLAVLADRTRRPQIVLGCAYVGAALSCILFGSAAGSSTVALIAAAALAGFCIVGGNGVANAFAGSYYPPAVRATGVGWGLGFGRLGSILGPLIGGILLSFGVPTTMIFAFFAVPAVLAALCAVSVRQAPERRTCDMEMDATSRVPAA